MLLGVITVGRKVQREARRNVRQRRGTGGRTMGRLIDAGLFLDNLSGRLESMKDYDAEMAQMRLSDFMPEVMP